MKIGIVGATGEVGRMMIQCLDEFAVPVTELFLFASAKSAGSTINFHNHELQVLELTQERMRDKYDFLLFSAGGKISAEFSPIAASAGNTIIDNSSAFRQVKGIPLIVPEINGDIILNYRGIIANPNCSTIQMVLALAPLDKAYNLKKVVVSTYQSVSGAGHKGISTLLNQRTNPSELGHFSQRIDYNVIPQIDRMLENGYCFEEEKMHFETRKILSKPELLISSTTVRVPVLYGHSEAVYCEFEKEIILSEAQQLLSNSPSLQLHTPNFVTPIEIEESNDSHVSRLRYGVDHKSLNFWCVGNNVRVGAASNAVRILLYSAGVRQLF